MARGTGHVHTALAEISPLFKEAIVASRIVTSTLRVPWISRAWWNPASPTFTHSGSTLQGASTITEQLAKLSLYGGATPPQSINYKIKEIVLGNELALHFTKDQILEMYVNRIFYGNDAVGIGSAAELYFLKPARQLDLAQASMLAGLAPVAQRR